MLSKFVLSKFVSYINKLHPSIQFAIDIKGLDELTFLDALVYRKGGGTPGYKVYSKLIHINLYLYATSCHYLTQMKMVLFTCVYWAYVIFYLDSLQGELNVLHGIFESKGYI